MRIKNFCVAFTLLLQVTADLSLPSVFRRNYASDGIRVEPPLDPIKSVLEVWNY